jgi:uracil-DNA glycosylase
MRIDADRLDLATAAALCGWLAEMGADEAVGDQPVNRYDLPAEPPWSRAAVAARPGQGLGQAPVVAETTTSAKVDPVAEAGAAAAAAGDLAALAAAMADFPHCELRKGAKNFVFADGLAGARVMIVGEAPGREEDLEGRPFVGAAGQMLDRMFAAIGLSRTSPDPAVALYITNVMPWRPPSNREPEPGEIAMMQPFLRRHVELADPDVIVLMGNTPCAALLGQRGILRLRGTWAEALGKPVLPMTHPSYLLRTPIAKREAWADLLALKARLNT